VRGPDRLATRDRDGPARHKVNADGRAPTLEEANTQFAAWEAFQRVAEEG